MTSFPVKDWRDDPDTTTPLSATALEDMETRLGDYIDASVSAAELGTASITSNFSTTSTTLVDVTSLSTTVTVGSRPVMVTFSCGYVSQLTAAAGWEIAILRGSTRLGGILCTLNPAVFGLAQSRVIRDNPGAGSYTYKVQLKTSSAGTAAIGADAGTTYGPAILSVVAA